MRLVAIWCVVMMLGVADAATVTVPGTYPSIQAAVQNAPDGSTIEVAPGHYHEQVVLQNDGRSLTLRGDPANPSTVVIDGDQVTTSVVRLVNSSATRQASAILPSRAAGASTR